MKTGHEGVDADDTPDEESLRRAWAWVEELLERGETADQGATAPPPRPARKKKGGKKAS
jgi:hypothetical protein